jgi:hypothetical protein
MLACSLCSLGSLGCESRPLPNNGFTMVPLCSHLRPLCSACWLVFCGWATLTLHLTPLMWAMMQPW